MRSELKYTKAEDIDREIQRLEEMQSTQSLPLAEEKRLLKEIQALRASKRMVSSLESQLSEATKGKESVTLVREVILQKREQMKVLQQSMDKVFEVRRPPLRARARMALRGAACAGAEGAAGRARQGHQLRRH